MEEMSRTSNTPESPVPAFSGILEAVNRNYACFVVCRRLARSGVLQTENSTNRVTVLTGHQDAEEEVRDGVEGQEHCEVDDDVDGEEAGRGEGEVCGWATGRTHSTLSSRL